MKKTILFLFALLPMALSAQVPKFPYTPQEVISLMPEFPSLEGMLQYSKGLADAQFTEGFISDTYTDDSDYSRFKSQYYQVLATYKRAVDEYEGQLHKYSKEQAHVVSDLETNKKRHELGGASTNEFSKKSQKEQEEIAMANAQMQMQGMGLGDVDIEKLSKMSDKEVEEYMAKHMQQQTGITAQEQKMLENMSEEEAMAYFSRPENQGKLAALQGIAAAAKPVEGNYQSQLVISPEEMMELSKLQEELSDFWNFLENSKIQLMSDAQAYWDSHYRAQYMIERQTILKNNVSGGIISKEEELKATAIIKGCHRRMAALEKEFYDWFMPKWRESVINMMWLIADDGLTKTTRYIDLSLKRDEPTQSPQQFVLTKQARQSEIISVLSEYMEMGEKLINYFVPKFYTENY